MPSMIQKIQLDRLSYVIYEHTDRDRFLSFADDFGFQVAGTDAENNVYLGGYGPDPYLYVARQVEKSASPRFVGAGFRARTKQDFERACSLDNAKVVDISRLPGGGQMVSIVDVNGFEMQVVYGQEAKAVPATGISSVVDGLPNVNGAITKGRKGLFNRLNSGPAMIHKLGHFGYITDNYAATCSWYLDRFNFRATDIVHQPGDRANEYMSFLRMDLGTEYSDHHCFLIAKHHGDKMGTDVHHSSFEVEDLDTQMMGHQWLAEKGYKSKWGVGRHIMGSQVFDYWYDPTGFIIEHYADGDVVNEETETTVSAGTAAAIWGPPLPTSW